MRNTREMAAGLTGATGTATALATASVQLENLTDEAALCAALDRMGEEETARVFHKRYPITYMNLFTLFHKQLPSARLREVATQVTKSAAWSHAAVERYLSSLPQRPPALRHVGWPRRELERFLTQGKGLIICTFRYGFHEFIALDLACLGFPVFCPLVKATVNSIKKSLDELQARIGTADSLDPAERQKLSQFVCGLNPMDVEERGTSIRLAKALHRGELLLLNVDGNNGMDGPWGNDGRVPVDILGTTLYVKGGPAKLSLLRGTPILPVISTKSSSWEGAVHIAEPILPPQEVSKAGKEQFIRTCMQTLYSFLEKHVRHHPEYWESVSAVHRWRRHVGAVKSPLPQPTPDAEKIAAMLQSGQRFRVNESGGILALPGEQCVLIDTNTAKCFRAPASEKDLFRALAAEDGLGAEWFQRNSDRPEQRQHLVTRLAELCDRNLIVVR